MTFFDINTPFKSNGWFKIKVQNKTMSKRYPHLPSELNMLRQARKSGK